MDIRVKLAVVFVVFAFGCRKDTISPVTPVATPQAEFSLVSSNNNCSNVNVQGSYNLSTQLGANEYVIVQVNITTPGKYLIKTADVNGISFSDSGTFTSTGIQNIFLKGSGTPSSGGVLTIPVTAGSSSCSFTVWIYDPAMPTLPDNDHMYLGNPSDAAPLTDSANNYLMRKTYYALSYSRDMGKPNWVSWHLNLNDLGGAWRQNDFRPDNTLPAGWYQVPSNAFSGSGFNRGHNIPSADRTSNTIANSSTFLMTNMIPQAPNNNQVTWASMEDSLRRLVHAGNELYIIMGNYGAGGTGSNGYAETLNSGRVTVPAFIWKVALVIPNSTNDSARIDAKARVISVLIPNNNNTSHDWKSYRTSVDAIEAATGYNLFTRLPDTLQQVLEAKVDNY